MITIGSLYAMAPRALGQPAMHSRGAMELHFWLHTSGVLIYVIAMWIAGIMQGQMWSATSPDGTLTYPFIDSLSRSTACTSCAGSRASSCWPAWS